MTHPVPYLNHTVSLFAPVRAVERRDGVHHGSLRQVKDLADAEKPVKSSQNKTKTEKVRKSQTKSDKVAKSKNSNQKSDRVQNVHKAKKATTR